MIVIVILNLLKKSALQPSEQQTSPRVGRMQSRGPQDSQPSEQLSTGVEPGTNAS